MLLGLLSKTISFLMPTRFIWYIIFVWGWLQVLSFPCKEPRWASSPSSPLCTFSSKCYSGLESCEKWWGLRGGPSLLFHLALIVADAGPGSVCQRRMMQRCEALPSIPASMYTQLGFTLGFKGQVQWGLSMFQGRPVEDTLQNPALPSHPSKDCFNRSNPNSSCYSKWIC